MKIDRHLPKHVKSFLFFEKFLGTRTIACLRTNCIEKSLKSTIHPLNQYLFTTYIDTYTEKLEILNKKDNWNRQQAEWLQQEHGQTNTRILNMTNTNVTNNSILDKSTQWSELYRNFNYFYKNKKSSLFYSMWRSIDQTIRYTSSNLETQRILYAELSPDLQTINKKQPSENRKASEEQLQHIFDYLSEELPMLFLHSWNYSIYKEDLVFINNIRGTSTIGLDNYKKQIVLLKLVGHLRFAYVKLDILKITMHPEDSSIKVRWRIVGVSGTNVFLKFWKHKVWNVKEQLSNQQSWYDGFSTFYVNNDGKIFKHVVDKMMPDENAYEKVKPSVATKLALFIILLDLDSYSCIELTLF